MGIYQKSRQKLLEEALGSISCDGQKPSVCFLRKKRKLGDCHLTVDDQLLRHKFLQALPPTTRVSLSAFIIWLQTISLNLQTRYTRIQRSTTK